jgi:hypothetical protein
MSTLVSPTSQPQPERNLLTKSIGYAAIPIDLPLMKNLFQ